MSNQNNLVFDLYKPLRNKIRKHNLLEALYIVWAYSRNYTFNLPFPGDIELPSEFDQSAELHQRRMKGIHEFELEFLTREFILHCHLLPDKNSILKKSNLGNIINYLRSNFDDGLHKIFDRGDILLDSHRWSHRQFKWQIGYDRLDMLRYHKIFSDIKVDELIKEKTGLTVNEIHLVGFYIFSISGNIFRHQFPIKSASTAVTQEMFDTFFEIYSMDIEEAREWMKESYRMDEALLYSFNPITAKPILIYQDTFICPMHLLLFWQITNGLYYHIVNEKTFKTVFGDAFENYIGEVISDVIDSRKILLHKEFIYGKEEKKTSDWILIDSKSIVFIECKSKRMTISSKSELDVKKGLESDIDKMATFVVQIYKTYLDYTSNKYGSIEHDDSLCFVPIVVTLEPWFINYNLRIPEMVKNLVQQKFISHDMDLELMERYPYHIFSCEEFESEIQIVSTIGGKAFAELYSTKKIIDFKKGFDYQGIFHGEYEKTFIEPLKN